MRRFAEPVLLALTSLFFLYAGGVKLLDPAAFARDIQAYRLVGEGLSRVAALWLPWLECVAAVLLWPRHWRIASITVLLGMLAAFQVALGSVMARGLDIDCGCLGTGIETGALAAFLRNIVLVAVLCYLVYPSIRKAK
jgi:putative oxidoreductase